MLLLLCGGDKSPKPVLSPKPNSSWPISAKGPHGKTKLKRFDTSSFLTDDKVIAEYLTAALEDPNPDVFLTAIGQVAKARGMSAIAESAGLGRESLYKALSPGAKPRYDTVLKVLQSLGVKVSLTVA